MNTVRLKDFLTPAEIKRAAQLYAERDVGPFAVRCAKEIIEPVMDRINTALDQKNDPMYLAYCVEYAMMESKIP